MNRWLLVLSSFSVLVGCRAQLDLGSNDAGAEAGAPSGEGGSSCPVTPEDAGSAVDAASMGDAGNLSPLLGTWQGYGENLQFPSGSTAIAIVFAQQSDGSIVGKVTYGQGTPPPPPTDPNTGYPPGADWRQHDKPYLIEGFPYTAVAVRFDGTRLQLQTNTNEAWKGWCELQTPTADGWPCGHYGCLPNGPGMANQNVCSINDPVTGQTLTVDCGKWVLCDVAFNTCSCSASRCTVDMSQGDTSFDMQLSGNKLDGSIRPGFPSSGPTNVHFTHSP